MSKEKLYGDAINKIQEFLIARDGKIYLNGNLRFEGLCLTIEKIIDQTREETIREIRKHDEEELIKIVDKLKLDVETRIAFKNLKPESVGYNKCALKVQIKIKQIKQLIKDYYAK